MTWGRTLLILLLGGIAMLLVEYAPLVPKAIILMDDIHELRKQSGEWKAELDTWKPKIDRIQKTLETIEKKVPFFKDSPQGGEYGQ